MKIGDKVVCIDASPCRCTNCPNLPVALVLGRVYVIKGFEIHLKDNKTLQIIVLGLPEFSTDGYHSRNDSYGAFRFRLLDEMKREASQVLSNQRTQRETAGAILPAKTSTSSKEKENK